MQINKIENGLLTVTLDSKEVHRIYDQSYKAYKANDSDINKRHHSEWLLLHTIMNHGCIPDFELCLAADLIMRCGDHDKMCDRIRGEETGEQGDDM